jgi:hypothetical protein
MVTSNRFRRTGIIEFIERFPSGNCRGSRKASRLLKPLVKKLKIHREPDG